MHSIFGVAALAAVLVALPSPALAGPLDPPAGPVASTGKTLTEVEPRTAINATNTPGNATAMHRITQPGSYYLTGNIVGIAGRNGIAIEADNVAIDLNGFVVQGVAGSLDGIATIGVRNNLTVRNGTVTGWGQDGIDLRHGGTGAGSLVVDVLSSSNGTLGIRVNSNAVVRGCGSHGNGLDGFTAIGNAVFVSCAANGNNEFGFQTGPSVVFENCSARANDVGFLANGGAVVTGCSAYENTSGGFDLSLAATISNSLAHENGGHGIAIISGSVIGCTAVSNEGDGIRVSSNGVVRGNTCEGNDAGIHATGSDNRIEENNCADNAVGIDVDVAGNAIVRNTCSGSSVNNWEVAAGNVCLVVQATTSAAITGNSGGVSPGTTSAWANISY